MRHMVVYTLYALAALIPLVFTTANYELFEFPKFIILLSGALIVGITWLFDAYKKKDWKLPNSPFNVPILAFAGSQLVATIFSIHPYTSFWGYYSRFHQGLLTTLCYTILYFAYLKYMDKKSTRNIIKISLATSFTISLYAILQRLGIDENIWVQDVVNRPFATLGQPNWMAAYLLPNIFLAYYYHGTSKKKSIYPYILHAVLFAGLLVSKSRSGYLAFALASLIYWLPLAWKNKAALQNTLKSLKKKPFPESLKPIAITLALYAGVALLTGTVWTEPIYTTINNQETPSAPAQQIGTQLETGGTESGDIRKIVWTGALNLFRKHPLVGTGVETFAYSYYWERPLAHNNVSEWDFLYNKAHSEYLNFAATSGILGLITSLLIFVYVGRYALIAWTKHQPAAGLALAVAAALTTIFITNVFGFSVIPVALLTYLLPAALARANTDHKEPPADVLDKTYMVVVALALLIPYRLFVADLNFQKGKILSDTGNYSQALPYLQKAAQTRPGLGLFRGTLAETLANLAVITSQSDAQSLSQQYAAQAAQEAEKTRALNPWHLNLHKSRAKTYLTLAQIQPEYYERAAQELEDARRLAPTDPKLAYNLGLVYSRLEDNDRAIEQMQDALRLKNNYEQPYYALTLLYEETRQPERIPQLLEELQANLATYSGALQTKIDKYLPN